MLSGINPKIIIIPVIIAIAAIIGVVAISESHPSLEEIIEKQDCQELGKWDLRMDEKYGFDINKGLKEENISAELLAQGTSLGMKCTLSGGSTIEDAKPKTENQMSDDEKAKDFLIKSIQNRSCQGARAWLDNHGYASDVGFTVKELGEIVSYDTYCKNFAIVQNGVDTSETWDKYPSWDLK